MVGKTLGHYEILAPLGAGGMGEVYRAHDTTLKRDVAIKVLPEDLSADVERLARLEREAQLLAALNHPNIEVIHGLEESDGVRFMVLELIEGESLAETLSRDRIEVERALGIARQIAEALEAAHAKGIIHRDLKPGNVVITPEGQAKVLDFGLAKSHEAEGTGSEVSPDITESPTVAVATRAGIILGTAAYMSPEQARGKPLDKRTDIWSFGCVLYEMLTGKVAFEGETVSDTLASILKEEPDWSLLPGDTPPLARSVLQRCLRKDPNRRLHDAADARIEIEEVLARPGGEAFSGSGQLLTDSDQQTKPPRLSWLLAALATVVAVVFGILWLQQGGLGPSGSDLRRFETALLPPDGTTFHRDAGISLSPDGRMLAFVIVGESSRQGIWIRALDSTTSRGLEGTEGATYPFWSPDSRNLGFFAGGSLKRVAAAGGPVETIAPATDARGGAWCASDQIVYSPNLSRGLATVPASGGEPATLTVLDTERGETQHRFPSCLPSGEHVLVLAQTAEGGSREDESHIDVVSLGTGERKEIIRANSSMAYSPSGHLLFWREGSLMAVPFETQTLNVTGEAQSVAHEVAYTANEYAGYSISNTGLLAYQVNDPTRAQSRLLTVDTAGEALGEPSPADIHRFVVVSHDGKRAAHAASDFSSLWIRDLVRGTVWSPDDEWLIFGTDREGVWQIFRRRALGLGSEELLLENALRVDPVDWSPDGKYLTVDVLELGADKHIALYTFEDQSFEVLIDTPFVENGGRFSPDGQWLAYTSNETGRYEIYVVPFPGEGGSSGGKYRVSTEGGNLPKWGPRGENLYYMSLAEDLMSVDLDLENGLAIGVPQKLFTIRHPPGTGYPYSVLPDGESFVINQLEESKTPDHTILVQNWLSRLPK